VLVLLIGLRCSGKTTIGRAAAEALGLAFIDLDDLTLRELNAPSVSQAWRDRGEAEFRRAEARALAGALTQTDAIVALGGGTPTAPGADALLLQATRNGAIIVYLRADAQTLRARMQGQTSDRPGLTGDDPIAEVAAVLAERDPLYRSLAQQVVQVDRLSEAEALAAVVAAVVV
jgi:shikimate kinase